MGVFGVGMLCSGLRMVGTSGLPDCGLFTGEIWGGLVNFGKGSVL